MRNFYICLIGAAIFVFTISAEASIHRLNPVDGYDCAGDMSIDDCFGPTATAGTMFVLECKAEGRQKQRCRDCMEAYNSNGESMGYNTCNYVRRDAGCSCYPLDGNCNGNNGSCNYYW